MEKKTFVVFFGCKETKTKKNLFLNINNFLNSQNERTWY